MTDFINIIDIFSDMNDKIYNNKPLAIELYKKGILPNKNYFEYEIEKVHKFQNDFKNNMSKRLKELNVNEKEFINVLKSFNGVISGSFVLQCAINEYWSSDIDMYVTYSSTMTMKESSEMYKLFNTENNKVTLIKVNEKDYKKYDDILGVDKFKINDLEIDLVWIKGDFEQYIYEKYDFDFCKSYYDGDNIYIKDLNAILNKQSYTKKYTKNNKLFTVKLNTVFNNNECGLEDKNEKDFEIEINHKYVSRIKKYKDRGFSIYMDVVHDEKLNILSFGNMNKKIYEKYMLSNYDIYDYDIIDKNMYNEIIDIFKDQESLNDVKIDENKIILKNKKNKITKDEENLKILLDIYENGLDKYFYKILNDFDFYMQIKKWNFLPNIKYDLYLSQNAFSIYIIIDKLKTIGIKNIIDNYKKYIIYGDFLNHCFYGSEYSKINIVFIREEDSNIYCKLESFKNIKITFHNIQNNRTLLSLINLNSNHKYYFNGDKIMTF